MNNKKIADIDPRAIAADFFRRLGGMEGMTKWGKTHRSLAYQLISKLMAQPMVQNNVAVSVNADDGEAGRRKLEDAFMRIIEARKASVGDPAVYVNGERLIEHQPQSLVPPPSAIDIQPSTDAAPPGTPDRRASGSNSEKLKSPNQGPLLPQGGVDATPGAASPGGGTKQKTMNSLSRMPSVPGLYAGAALDESADNRSTTEKYLSWTGHGRPP
jgi:hypothetical protein